MLVERYITSGLRGRKLIEIFFFFKLNKMVAYATTVVVKLLSGG
jgi:hypothetical protein